MRHSVGRMTCLSVVVGTLGAAWLVYGQEDPIKSRATNESGQGNVPAPDADFMAEAAGVAGCSASEPAAAFGSDGEPYIPTPRPLPDDVQIEQHVANPEGGAVGAVAESAGSFMVYSNTRSKHVIGPTGAAATSKVADDVAITVLADCLLEKYVVKVLGNRDGVPSPGLFNAIVGLYKTCPGATSGATPIPGTACVFNNLSGTGVHQLTYAPPPTTNVKLPDNFYVAVSFSRDNCGVIVGAPAELGFSADLLDWPGIPCVASLGGYPGNAMLEENYPHASFWLEVYAKQECDKSYVGYKNSYHAGDRYTPGAGIYFADDIKLGVNACDMIAYEVAVKGMGAVRIDLRTSLSNSNPQTGGLIPGTENVYLSFSNAPQVVRFPIDPPIPMPLNFWITFKTTTSTVGPLFTNQRASLGTTEDQFCAYMDGEWRCGPYSWNTYVAFDVTIMCAGEPPVGACCDMALLDEQGEAVCYELPEMNCGFPDLWREGRVCESTCEGGTNDGQPCTRQADCPGYSCLGGTEDGLVCDPHIPDDCPDGSCNRAQCPGPFAHPCGLSACCTHNDFCFDCTQNECYARPPVDKPRIYVRGKFCDDWGFWCPWGACLSREGECAVPHVGVGCENPFCCTEVCEFDPWCCRVEWDECCVRWTQDLCTVAPRNDSCFDANPDRGVRLVDVGGSVLVATSGATEDWSDPGFCCNSDAPGANGYGTVWFKFVATDTSARVSTCNSPPQDGDTLVQVFRATDSSTPEAACGSLDVIACSDDIPGCGTGVHSDVCVTDLVPGETYYVLLASKEDEDDESAVHEQGLYRLQIDSPCTPQGNPPNDLCRHAAPAADGATEFDLGGATFDCPAGPSVIPEMRNDVWYEWKATCLGQAKITTCNPTGHAWNQPATSLVVYHGCDCPADINNVVASSLATGGTCGASSTVTFDTVAGDCYKIRLGGRLGGEPSGKLTISCDPACPPGAVEWLDPPDGVVDARQPHPIDVPMSLRGIDTIIVRAPEGADTACWTLCETNENSSLHPPYPPELENNYIVDVRSNGDGTYTLTLIRPITPGEVTTLTYTDDGGGTTTGAFISHPANVNGDGFANPVDILAMIDILNGVAASPWGIYSSDIDHSGVAAPADILAVIDLLNHGWFGTALPSGSGECP